MSKDLNLKVVINGEDRSGPALAKTKANVQSISDQLGTLQSRLSGFLALKVGEVIGGQLGELLHMTDAYKTLDARLKQVSDSSAEYARAQEEVLDIAQETRGDLEATAGVYGKVETALDELGGTQQQALDTTETLNKAIALTSEGAAQDAAAIQQFGQALGSGVLRGDEFNSVMENSPGLAQALADGLGVPITKLREMAEAGQLTSDRLINALGKSADIVDKKFQQMPLTVSSASTQFKNAFMDYVGDADKASGATGKLAAVISALASNLKPLADTGILIAEIYGARMVVGLLKSAESYLEHKAAAEEATKATEDAAEAAEDALKIDVQVANVRVKTARALIEEARLQAALATTETQRAQAQNLLAQAMRNYHGAVDAANAAQEALDGDTEQATQRIGRFSGIVEKLRGLVEKAFIVKIAIDAVGGALEWMGEYNEKVRIFSFAWQGAIEKVMAVTGHFVSGEFLNGNEALTQKLAEIDLKYGDLAMAATDSAQKTATAEQQKAQAVEQAAIKQQQAFSVVQEATKALTASIDADVKAQTAAIQQSLANRMAAIDAMDISETQKAQLRVQAQIQAYETEQQLQQQAAQNKLALIDQEYQAELAQAEGNAQRTADIEAQKRQALLSTYSGLAEFYQGEVGRLGQVYASEYQAAQAAKQQLQALDQSHEQALFNITLSGLTEREKLSARESKFAADMRAIKAEQAKGDQADQQKINDLLTAARTLHGEITSAAGKGSSAIYDAKKRENEIYSAQKAVLEDNAADHEANAKRAKSAQDHVAAQLRETQTAIADITAKLNQDYALKIGVNEGSLAAIKSTIAELTKPETKTITIQTVQSGTPAQATGGPAGQPTGRPWRFNTGGFTPRSGKLPGFGGGDKIRALLEAGEFIVRKEAVQKLGLPFMHAVNNGQAPTGGDVIKRAMGGSVGYNMDDELDKAKDERDKELIKRMLGNTLALGLGNVGGFSAARAAHNMNKTLQKMGRTDLSGKVSEIINNSVGKASQIGANTKENAARNREKFDRAKVLTEHLFDQPAAGLPDIKTPKISLPKPVIPALPKTSPLSIAGETVGKTERIQFIAPNGQSLTGTFKPGDTGQMLRILKDAGAVTA